MSATPIETLRAAFAHSIIATLASQVGAYLRLISHPDAQLRDLLEALDRGPVIADDAARRLHIRLGLPGDTSTPVLQRAYWVKQFAERNFDPYEPIRPAIRPAPEEAAPTT